MEGPQIPKFNKPEKTEEKFERAPGGWYTKTSLANKYKVSKDLIAKLVAPHRDSHPEWFVWAISEDKNLYEFFSKELTDWIERKIKDLKDVPRASVHEFTNKALANKLGIDPKTLFKLTEKDRKNHPEWFVLRRYREGTKSDYHYTKALVDRIGQNFEKIPKATENEINTPVLAKKLGTSQVTAKKLTDPYRKDHPEWFVIRRDKMGRPLEHYTKHLLDTLIKKEVQKARTGEIGNTALAEELGVNPDTINTLTDPYRKDHPEWFVIRRDKINRPSEHYTKELVDIIRERIFQIKKEVEPVVFGEITLRALSGELGVGPALVQQLADPYRKDHPEWFLRRRFNEKAVRVDNYYTKELADIIRREIEEYKNIPEASAMEMTNSSLANKLDIDPTTLSKMTDPYRQIHPEWFVVRINTKTRRPRRDEYYVPEFISVIEKQVSEILRSRKKKMEEGRLKENLESLAQEIIDGETEKGKKLMEIIRLLPGHAHDIILRHHPEFKGMSVTYVKSVIAEYIGDFVVSRREWQLADIEKVGDLIGIENIRETILLNLKNSCLTFVNKERKNNPSLDEFYLVEKYFEQPEIVKASSSGIKEIEDAFNDVREYYRKLAELRGKKPANIVEKLKEGRVFPDINQLLNIQEIKEKNRMLIADEMGLGKSASAILTKEYLGLKTALIIMPSNVETTWHNYLSDKVGEDEKQIGYFKKGLIPKVLVIEGPKDIEKLNKEEFDYVLISQEKLSSEHYEEALSKIDFDMMIIDEIHKLKNIEEGVRSEAVVRLTEKIKGENKYLALLSGTPVPNKVKDIAITLKLLYPEKYEKIEDKELVRQIIHGDLIDLRSELLPRMQMKELQASIEIPPLEERDIIVEMPKEERGIYEILLEEDELTASEKIIVFRQFLLNPTLLKIEPGFIGSKVEELKKTLQEDLKIKDKIVVFVNSYIEGVIRGDSNIISKLDLPPNVIIEEIHGKIKDKAERNRIENELKLSDKKMVVFVSGGTADVGVDFSGAEGVIFYNEPWSKYEKRQQLSRVYREGLKQSLVSKTLITKDSIEEGIRQYINAKEKAIEKLFQGIPRTEAEKKLLLNDAEKLVRSNDVETNAELSKEYLSEWEKLMIHFGQGLFAGEKRFLEESPERRKEYAKLYRKLGKLTYQGNNARVTATILEKMVREKGEDPARLRIIDMASGPEMLKETVDDDLKDRIFSLDINPEHFAYSTEPRKTFESSYLSIPANNGSVDYYNMGFAFHQTKSIKYYKKNYERLQVLAEMNRVLKPGGRAVISMLYNVKLTNPDKFSKLLDQLGFKLVENYSGDAEGGVNYRAGFYTLEKINNISEYQNINFRSSREEKEKQILELAEKLGREFLEGLEMDKVGGKLKDQRRMIEKVKINGKEIELILNDKDKELLEKEKEAIRDGEGLKAKHGGISNIPLSEIKKIGFERKLQTPGYYILYKLVEGGGAVVIRGDYKSRKLTR